MIEQHHAPSIPAAKRRRQESGPAVPNRVKLYDVPNATRFGEQRLFVRTWADLRREESNMGNNKKRLEQDTETGLASPVSLIGQLLQQGMQEEKLKWYGLLVFLPRFYLTLRFDRRMRQIFTQMEAAQRAGGAEAKAAQQQFTSEFMALLVEKKLLKLK